MADPAKLMAKPAARTELTTCLATDLGSSWSE
jgi:hypothetical protein